MRFLSPAVVLATLLSSAILCASQQPPASSATPVPPVATTPPSGLQSAKGKTKPVPSFLILGTVFNEQALSFPGVRVRVRRSGEKKFEWETYTNARGEFAIRVPPGVNYEVVVHEKKYKEQTAVIDSKVDVQQRVSIKLERISPPTTGAKS